VGSEDVVAISIFLERKRRHNNNNMICSRIKNSNHLRFFLCLFGCSCSLLYCHYYYCCCSCSCSYYSCSCFVYKYNKYQFLLKISDLLLSSPESVSPPVYYIIMKIPLLYLFTASVCWETSSQVGSKNTST